MQFWFLHLEEDSSVGEAAEKTEGQSGWREGKKMQLLGLE